MKRSRLPAPAIEVAVVVVALLDALLGATPGDPVEWVLSGIAALALFVRRRLPYLAFALTVPALVLSNVVVAAVLALYAVARYGRGRRALAVCAIVVGAGYVVSWFAAGLATLPGNLILLDVLYGVMIAGAPMFLGLLVNARRDLSQRLLEIDEARDHERQLTAQSVLAAERARLAREMHDVVSHQVSLIAVQAGALQVSAVDGQTRAAAATIRRLSVDTLDELRHMVSLLRAASGPLTELAPQPTLADLERLVAGSGIERGSTSMLPRVWAHPCSGRSTAPSRRR